MEFDVIIVGAGSAGCPLAARLSEDPALKILLLEAGPYFESITDFPPELQNVNSFQSSVPGHPNNWSFTGQVSERVAATIPRGRVVGGSSALNGAVFIRGTPEDFDGWAALGNDQWSYEKVLPYFCKLETDHDCSGDYHGCDGPVPLRRVKPGDWVPLQTAFIDACLALGFPYDADKNAPDAEGVGSAPTNAIDGVRMNMAVNYLRPAAARPNLTIQGDTFVRRVVFEGDRATGVEAERGGRTSIIRGGEVILCAGAIKSPHLLLLSGIGPVAELRAAGIKVLADAPAVGKAFVDHPAVAVHYKGRAGRKALKGWVALQYTAKGSAIRTDMEILPLIKEAFPSPLKTPDNNRLTNRVPLPLRHPLRTLMALRGISLRYLADQVRRYKQHIILCVLQQPESRGEISLRSPDPHVAPALSYHYFISAFDRSRMREAVRLAAKLLDAASYKSLGGVMTNPAREVLDSDLALNEWMIDNVMTAVHMAGSCRMGPINDTGAVVDQFGRVRGVQGLRVADSSIQPNVVRRGANATAVMIGERMADLVKATLRDRRGVSADRG